MVIEAKNLTREFKTYEGSSSFFMLNQLLRRKGKTKVVVDNINISIKEGEFIGYLGPNGAGKSTTLKMLSGILTPTAGQVKVLGIDPFKNRKSHAYNIGVLYGQRTQLWWDLPLYKSFELIQAIYNIPNDIYAKRLADLVEKLDMEEFMQRPVRVLSLGQRMRGELVASLLHKPPILFLDEPTIGLDVIAKDRIREFLSMLNKEEKVTIILTSHNIDDIKELCSRVIIIDNGKVMFDGKQEELRKLVKQHKILEVEVDPAQMQKTTPLESIQAIENRLYFEIENDSEVPSMVNQISNYYTILKMSILDPGMEGIVRDLYTTKKYAGE